MMIILIIIIDYNHGEYEDCHFPVLADDDEYYDDECYDEE